MEALIPVHPESLLAQLAALPDPRRRQGRRYPLPAIVGLLLLAAMHGETSLRGMWLWACARWDVLWAPLGFWTPQRPPTLTTIWNLLVRLDGAALDRLLSTWSSGGAGAADQHISVDGKTLRGSRRQGQPAQGVVEAVSHARALVLRQQERGSDDELAAALALLREVPLAGRVVTVDAGLLQRPVLEVILARGGAYVGVLKGNHPEVSEAVDTWLAEPLSPPGARAAADAAELDEGPRAAGTARTVGGRGAGTGRVPGAGVRLAGRAAGGLGAAPLAALDRRQVAGGRDAPVDHESAADRGRAGRTGAGAARPLGH